MIYLELLFSFLKIGLFAFGGAYGAIPLIRDVVMAHGWADEAMFANLVALSETTPGPIMVNMATYIGCRQAGLAGGILATLGVVLPSFLIILAVTILFQSLLKRPSVQAILKGIKPCLMGVILATGVSMGASICTGGTFHSADLTACAILLFLGVVTLFYRKLKKAELSPILLISLAAVCGCIFY